MRCKASIQGAKDYYEEHVEDYYVARNTAFLEFIADKAEAYCDGNTKSLDSVEFAESITEVFEFPDEGDWLASEYEGMLGDCADQAYEEYRDRQMFGDEK